MGEPLILLSDFSTTECDEIFVSIFYCSHSRFTEVAPDALGITRTEPCRLHHPSPRSQHSRSIVA